MPVAKIIILNWNGADHLRRFLPSVVAAAPAGVEVDDARLTHLAYSPEIAQAMLRRQQAGNLTPEALQQEHNLIYVAITRAKHTLTYITGATFKE